MDRAAMAAISQAFRSQFEMMDPAIRLVAEQTMQIAFEVKNLRSVRLWTRIGTQQRNFINPSIGLGDFTRRVAFAQAVIEGRVPTFPVKTKFLRDYTNNNGKKLKQYLENDYTRNGLTRVDFGPSGIVLEYDAYGNGYPDDDTSEEDLDEFLVA